MLPLKQPAHPPCAGTAARLLLCPLLTTAGLPAAAEGACPCAGPPAAPAADSFWTCVQASMMPVLLGGEGVVCSTSRRNGGYPPDDRRVAILLEHIQAVNAGDL